MTKKELIDLLVNLMAVEWGYGDDWDISWNYDVKDLPESKRSSYSRSSIEYSTTERWAVISVDPKIRDCEQLAREIAHELGHPIVDPIWRGISDWFEHVFRSPQKRATIEDAVNTRENEVIDWMVTQVMRVGERYGEECQVLRSHPRRSQQ